MPQLTHCRPSIILAVCLYSTIAGCHAEVPVPTPPATTSTTPPVSTEATSSSVTDSANDVSSFELEPDFQLLTLDQFESFGAESETWKEANNKIVCSGKPRGYLYSKQPYQNFTLRLEYRFPRPDTLKDDAKFKGNTGFLIYITGDHKLWPTCLEVQGKHVQMAAIKENGGAQPVVAEDNDVARQSARKPVGQWNAIEVVSKGGELQSSINGVVISKSQPDFLSDGPIGIQAEDHPFEVRHLRIRVE